MNAPRKAFLFSQFSSYGESTLRKQFESSFRSLLTCGNHIGQFTREVHSILEEPLLVHTRERFHFKIGGL